MTATDNTPHPRHVVLVTGPSGAGLSTASNTLEDAGFEAIDNLPLRLVLPLLEHPGPNRPLALGLDMRNRDFGPQSLLDLMKTLAARTDINAQLLYLDCRTDVILQRYSATRRRHPIADAPTLAAGIAAEIEQLRPVRARADILIDTSDLNPHELRAEIDRWLSPQAQRHFTVLIQSFSYKRGLPHSADMVFDCRFLKNPHWEVELRTHDGRTRIVQDFVASDPSFSPFYEKVLDLMSLDLPAAKDEGKSYFTIAFGCSGGKHRSVTLAERLTQTLAEQGWQVSSRHRELDLGQSKETHA